MRAWTWTLGCLDSTISGWGPRDLQGPSSLGRLHCILAVKTESSASLACLAPRPAPGPRAVSADPRD